MNDAKRWLQKNWKLLLGVTLALAVWTFIAVNTGSGLGF